MFCSRVSGKTHQQSDLDIGILPQQTANSYHLLLNVRSDLKDVFPNELVDVRYLTNTSPLFFFESVYKGKLLYGDAYEYAQLSAKAFKQYVDSQKLRNGDRQ